MIRSLWIARTGLDAQQTQLDVISNNLANVSTNGFKRGRAVFEDLLYQTLRQPAPSRRSRRRFPPACSWAPVCARYPPRASSRRATSRRPTIARCRRAGQRFFQVLLPDGTTGYTRDGSFQKDNQGQIVTSDGYPVQPNITIPANALTVSIGTDGTVSMTQPGTAATTQIGSIQLATFINPGGLQSIGQNLFLETAASGTPTPNTPGTNGAGIVNQGYVETSNVNVAEELVTMIQTQRAYELNSKVVSTSDAMLGRLTQL
jgi:flagellar basal-body rod protein FlgG